MSVLTPENQKYADAYYGQLKDATILTARGKVQGEQLWPTFTVRLADGTMRVIEVSRDSEGNGPGFLFGLPDVR